MIVQIQGKTVSDGLRQFLASSAVLNESADAPQAVGLQEFLNRVGPLLSTTSEVPRKSSREPEVETTRLEDILRHLHEPLRCAQGRGAFLNVWSIAGLQRSEVRHAAVLAWFLNPRGSHGFSDAFLRLFFQIVAARDSNWVPLCQGLRHATVRTEEWPLGSETDRVDIAIDGQDFAVFVEVKIDAPEGPDQINRYLTSAKSKAVALRRTYGRVIYLSSSSLQVAQPDLATMSWREVARALTKLPNIGVGSILARQFSHHINVSFGRERP